MMGNRARRVAVVSVVVAGAYGCAYQHARPLRLPPVRASEFAWDKPGQTPNPRGRYYYSALPPGKNNSDRLLCVLTFSGGGTRAAALAYGVLDELSRIKIPCSRADDVDSCADKT